jgi:hypothetical protein
MPQSHAFASLGRERFEELLEQEEPHEQPSPELEGTMTSLRIPLFKIRALDTVARSMGLSRQALILMLVDSAIGDAITAYAEAFGDNFVEFHPVQGCLDFVSKLDHVGNLDRAYLIDAVQESLGLEGIFNA